jgi:hypothetical protein
VLANVALPLSIVVPAVLLSVARFENQRWIRLRSSGVQGDSPLVGAFVDITGGLSLIFAFFFTVAYAYDFGITSAVALLVVTFLAGILWTAVSTIMLGGDNVFVWMIGTVAIWPLAIWLSTTLTWFNLL